MKNEKDKNEPLEKFIYETNFGKYKLVHLAARWAKELKLKEENKDFTYGEVIDMALRDILTGKITPEEIEKLPPITTKKKKGEKVQLNKNEKMKGKK